ncbi:MAG: AraC family transcriptional regulator [Lysobacter sp.]
MSAIRSNRTVAHHFVCAALAGAQRRGVDIEALLGGLGIPATVLTEQRSRLTRDQFAAMLNALGAQMNDELLGLGYKPLPFGSFGMICRALIHSRTLGRAMHQASRYYALMQDGRAHFFIAREGDRAYLTIDHRDFNDPDHFLTEILLVAGHRFCSWLIGDRIPLRHVELTYPEPRHAREFDRSFAAPFHFGAARTALCFNASYLDLPVVQDGNSLRAFLRNSALELLEWREQGVKTTSQVRVLLDQDDNGVALQLGAAAQRLMMSAPSLRRHLQREGTTFLEIKDRWRRDLAITLLVQTRVPISEIALRTGFAEPSSFHRAFKKWTGLLPSAYRSGP